MSKFNIGDIVARKSYGLDVLFKVAQIEEGHLDTVIKLKGLCYRLQADAPEADLELTSERCVQNVVE